MQGWFMGDGKRPARVSEVVDGSDGQPGMTLPLLGGRNCALFFVYKNRVFAMS